MWTRGPSRLLLMQGVIGLLIAGCQSEPGLIRVEGSGFFNPPSLDYGTRAVGDAHELRTTLRNSSAERLQVQDIRFEPPQVVYAAFLTDGGTLRGAVLRPSEAVEITLVYRPLAEGDYDATLFVEANTLEIPLEITARARQVAPARPELAPNRVRFFGSEVGRDVFQGVRITNAGDTDGNLAAVGSRAPFSITAPGGGPLSLPSVRLAPGESLDVEVHYRPGAPGPLSDRLPFRFDTDQEAFLDVSGDAVVAGELDCDVSRVDFGLVPRGQLLRHTVRCQTIGGPYALSAVRLADGSAEHFRVLPEQPVMAEGVLQFDVEFESVGQPTQYDGLVSIVPLHQVVTQIAVTAETVGPTPGEAALEAVLVWNTPDSDFDLHLVRNDNVPFRFGEDCYFDDKNPDWGEAGYPGDDPLLVSDDVNGFGPEQVSLLYAGESIYDLWVHYYGYGRDTAPSTTVMVTYQLRGQAEQSLTRDLLTCGEAWHVGRFEFDQGVGRFTPRGGVVLDYQTRASEQCRP